MFFTSGWNYLRSIWCPSVPSTTTYVRGRWPGSAVWSPPSPAPHPWPPLKWWAWKRWSRLWAPSLAMTAVPTENKTTSKYVGTVSFFIYRKLFRFAWLGFVSCRFSFRRSYLKRTLYLSAWPRPANESASSSPWTGQQSRLSASTNVTAHPESDPGPGGLLSQVREY